MRDSVNKQSGILDLKSFEENVKISWMPHLGQISIIGFKSFKQRKKTIYITAFEPCRFGIAQALGTKTIDCSDMIG